jgi:hypothetical protein
MTRPALLDRDADRSSQAVEIHGADVFRESDSKNSLPSARLVQTRPLPINVTMPFALLLREAGVLRPPEFEHPVQRVRGDGDFDCSTPIASGSEPVSDDRFEAADVSLHQGTPIIPRSLLPSHASTPGNDLQMPMSHGWRRLRCVARHSTGARWDDDGGLRMTRGDIAVDAVLIVSTVGSQRGDRSIHLIEQSANLRGIVHVTGGQRSRRDLAGVSVDGDV